MTKPFYEDNSCTIYHGDCREIMPSVSADVLVTDPPYGMDFVSSWTTQKRPVANDKDTAERDHALSLWGDRPALVFGTWRVDRPTGTRNVLVWHKVNLGPGMGDLSLPWGHSTEEIYVLGGGFVGRRRSNVIATTDQRGGSVGIAALVGHPTPKCVGVMGRLLDCCPAEWVVLDPFMGSGTTLRAAKDLGRKAIGIEIEERYCEIAARRLSQEVMDLR